MLSESISADQLAPRGPPRWLHHECEVRNGQLTHAIVSHLPILRVPLAIRHLVQLHHPDLLRRAQLCQALFVLLRFEAFGRELRAGDSGG